MFTKIITNQKTIKFIERIFLKYSSSIFLFHGLEGIGKKTLASIFAINLLRFNLENSDHLTQYDFTNLNFSNSKAYNLFKNRSHPDLFFLETDNQSSITIDKIRGLKYFLNSTCSISKYKVVIIDSIDYLSLNSLNMMLKSLEEPPENTYIFLISHNSSKIIETINSRVFKFYFKPPSLHEFVDILDKKQQFKENVSDLKLIGSILSYSPGLTERYYNKNFIKNYNNLLNYFSNALNKCLLYDTLEFIDTNDKKNDIYIKITFINRIMKFVLYYLTSGKSFETISSNEQSFFNSINPNDISNDLFNKFTKFQNDLFKASQLNVNKNDIIDNYLKSLYF